jgi:hypothetical protein
VQLVRLYDVSFSVRQAPYLISYATYVAATIHVRLASSSPPDSAAHESLAVCLTVLDLNSKTNPAVRKASVVIEALMKAMSVNMEKPHANSSGGNDASGAIQRDSRINGTSTSNSNSTQQLPDQTGRSSNSSTLAQHSYARGTLAPYSQQQTNVQQPNIMVPADVADGSAYAVEPGSEYFGDFAFDGMDDILFGFNASESIFQDFM